MSSRDFEVVEQERMTCLREIKILGLTVALVRTTSCTERLRPRTGVIDSGACADSGTPRLTRSEAVVLDPIL